MASRLKHLLWIAASFAVGYLPFLGFRMLRTAGDEKVYVIQAYEMFRDGRWFVQTVNDLPDYYKGPLHLGLVHIGFYLFGETMWATLYMNVAFLFMATVALYWTLSRARPGDSSIAAGVSILFAFSLGTYAHSFSSQMEVELIAFYALAVFFLYRSESGFYGASLGFWVVAGIAGWSKSPVHSALLSISGICYWMFSGSLLRRLRTPREWLFGFIGAGVGVLGYAPLAWLDWDNFYARYIVKETLQKTGGGEGRDMLIWPLFTYFSFPWSLLLAASILTFDFSRFKEAVSHDLLKLAAAVALPTIGFFCYFPYRYSNYTLPAISALSLAGFALWPHRELRTRRIVLSAATALIGLLFVLLGLGLLFVQQRFSPWPEWCPSWALPLSASLMMGAGLGWIWGCRRVDASMPTIGFSTAIFFAGVSITTCMLGERELVDLKRVVAENGRNSPIGYYNLRMNIWSEWAYLRMMSGLNVRGIHNREQLVDAIKNEHWILINPITQPDALETLQSVVATIPASTIERFAWKRWRTHGRDSDGESLWKTAWNTRQISVLEHDYWIIRVRRR